jgi:hypothetical protein
LRNRVLSVDFRLGLSARGGVVLTGETCNMAMPLFCSPCRHSQWRPFSPAAVTAGAFFWSVVKIAALVTFYPVWLAKALFFSR